MNPDQSLQASAVRKPRAAGAQNKQPNSRALEVDRTQRLADVGARIAAARQRAGWTQRQLSLHMGKSRGTIVQYEQGRIEPPLGQIEVMANALGVSPEFLAFGRQGISGFGEAAEPVVSVAEIEYADGEGRVTGGYGLTESLASDRGIDREKAKAVVLPYPAPAFGLAARDRVIVNPSDTLDEEGQLYLLRTRRGVDVIKLLPNLSERDDVVKVHDSSGETHAYERRELQVLGRIVATIR
jgi:transcriptional regulator with XRE-family HTH domain